MDVLVDFDGTCVTHEYPAVGHDIGAAPVLKELIANGHNLILFTMRGNDMISQRDGTKADFLEESLQWFRDNDIELYGIQTNPTQHTWTNSPKAYGQLIIDDIAAGCPLIHPDDDGRAYVDWVRMREILVETGWIVE